MRVIAGTKKGAKLFALEGESTRPTTDRVKESMFNIIQWQIRDAVGLDLFAGSGGLGIELLSRGARHVDFVDSSREATAVIEKNIKKLKLEEFSKIFCFSYENALKFDKKYDIIILDPPYLSDYIDRALEQIVKNNLLAEGGIVICETKKDKVINGSSLKLKKEVCYGITKLSFFETGETDG